MRLLLGSFPHGAILIHLSPGGLLYSRGHPGVTYRSRPRHGRVFRRGTSRQPFLPIVTEVLSREGPPRKFRSSTISLAFSAGPSSVGNAAATEGELIHFEPVVVYVWGGEKIGEAHSDGWRSWTAPRHIEHRAVDLHRPALRGGGRVVLFHL